MVASVQRRIFVHVGCAKAGTTFLQSALWQSRDVLRSHGVELPVDRLSHYHLALAVRDKLNPDTDSPKAFTVQDRFARALSDSAAATVVVSNELLAGATAEQAASLRDLIRASLAEAEVHLVITARDLARLVPSAWQQRIQQRKTISWDDYLESVREGTWPGAEFLRSHDPADIASRWAADLPPHRVHIVTLPPPTAPRGLLLERFCGVIGIDAKILSDSVPSPNESLGFVQAELLRRVNVALGDRLKHSRAGYGRVGKSYFAHQVLAPMGGERPSLPPEMTPWCQEQTERLIATIEQGGYDVAGDLDDLRSVPASTAPSVVGDSEIAASAVGALADLLDQRHQDLVQLDELQNRPVSVRRRRPIRRMRRRLGRRIRRRLSQLLPPTYGDQVAVARRRRRRFAVAMAAGAAVVALAVGIAQASLFDGTSTEGPDQGPSLSLAESWTPERIRAEGTPMDVVPTTASGLSARQYAVCDGSLCEGDSGPLDDMHAALEVTQQDQSAVFDLHYSNVPWVRAFDDDSVLVQDADGLHVRYRLLQADGTEEPLQLLDDPAPASPGPGVFVIDDFGSWNIGMDGAEDTYLIDERAGTLRPLDVPDEAVRYWGPNVNTFLWGVTDDCRVFWQTAGTLEHRRFNCQQGSDFTSMQDDWFPPGWLQPGRMAVAEQHDPGNRMVIHVSLDSGNTWQQIPVTGEDTIADTLQQIA